MNEKSRQGKSKWTVRFTRMDWVRECRAVFVPNRHPRDRIVRAAVVGALVLVLAACGTSTSTTTTTASGQVQVSCHIEFAKTKFLLHSGIAVGAFQRYIFKPYRAGAFKKGAPGRRKALLKAGATAVLVGHELKLAARTRNATARC